MQKSSKISIFLLVIVLVAALAGCNAYTRGPIDGVTYTTTPDGPVTTYGYDNFNPWDNTTRMNMGTPADPYNGTITGQTGTTTSVLANRINSISPYTDGMTALTATDVRTRLGLDTTMFEDSYFLDSRNNVGELVYVVKVRDEADKAAVRQAFNRRLATLNDAALATMPDRLSMSREGRIVENGQYMMLVVSPNQENFVNSFNAMGDDMNNNSINNSINNNTANTGIR